MAAKKKKQEITAEAAFTTTDVTVLEQPRIAFYFGPYRYYAPASNALALMAVEAVTRGAKLPALREFAERYRLKIEAFAAETGGEPLLVCDHDGFVHVPPKAPPAKKVRAKKAAKK